jgi:hypothetical protein
LHIPVVLFPTLIYCAADGKTKSLASALSKVAGAGKKVLLVLDQADEMVMRAGRNLEKLTINVASSVQVSGPNVHGSITVMACAGAVCEVAAAAHQSACSRRGSGQTWQSTAGRLLAPTAAAEDSATAAAVAALPVLHQSF